jgi:iron complex outermembrane receptor protein
MLYQDQLVLTGALDDVGAALHENIGKSYRTGVEITANYPLTEKWKLLLNTTISQNYNQNYYVETPSGMIQYGNTAIAFSPNFITNFTVNYSPIKNISFSIINKWVSKQYINNTQTEEYKLDPYFLSDFNFAYQNKFKNTEVGIYLLVNNILNKKYTNYGVDYGTPYYYAQARANFSIGINLKFF